MLLSLLPPSQGDGSQCFHVQEISKTAIWPLLFLQSPAHSVPHLQLIQWCCALCSSRDPKGYSYEYYIPLLFLSAANMPGTETQEKPSVLGLQSLQFAQYGK